MFLNKYLYRIFTNSLEVHFYLSNEKHELLGLHIFLNMYESFDSLIQAWSQTYQSNLLVVTLPKTVEMSPNHVIGGY